MVLRVPLENYCKHDDCQFDTTIESKFHQLSLNSHVNNNLFTFLIENNMNRFLFGFITGIKDLNLDNIDYYNKLLRPNEVEEICKESFIKKFHCPECGNLLFREHLDDINYKENYELKCPDCGKYSNFSFFDLEDEFKITKLDLIKFLDKLVDLEVFNKKLETHCQNCTKSELLEDFENVNLKCSCGNLKEIKFKYYSNYDFILDRGFWFEWYVFNLCKNLYRKVYPNVRCTYVIDGKEFECEIDILAATKDHKLIAFECKDYMKSKLSLKDFIENISKLHHIAHEIYLVSSVKDVKFNSKIESSALIDSELKFIEGMKLEESFLNADNIISFFEERHYNIVSLFDKLPDSKKEIILDNLIDLIIKNEDWVYLESLTNLLTRISINIKLINEDKLLTSLGVAFENVYSKKFISYSLEYIKNIYFSYPKVLKNNFDLNKFLKHCTQFLNPISNEGYECRAPFYYFITAYFRNELIDINLIDRNIAQEFLLKFIPMIEVYYGSYSLENTLNVFKCLWDYVTPEIENKFISKLIYWYKTEGNIYVISNFIKDFKINLSKDNVLLLEHTGII